MVYLAKKYHKKLIDTKYLANNIFLYIHLLLLI